MTDWQRETAERIAEKIMDKLSTEYGQLVRNDAPRSWQSLGQGYWVDEGTAPTATNPTWVKVELKLNKVADLRYATHQIWESSHAPYVAVFVREAMQAQQAEDEKQHLILKDRSVKRYMEAERQRDEAVALLRAIDTCASPDDLPFDEEARADWWERLDTLLDDPSLAATEKSPDKS